MLGARVVIPKEVSPTSPGVWTFKDEVLGSLLAIPEMAEAAFSVICCQVYIYDSNLVLFLCNMVNDWSWIYPINVINKCLIDCILLEIADNFPMPVKMCVARDMSDQYS